MFPETEDDLILARAWQEWLSFSVSIAFRKLPVQSTCGTDFGCWLKAYTDDARAKISRGYWLEFADWFPQAIGQMSHDLHQYDITLDVAINVILDHHLGTLREK